MINASSVSSLRLLWAHKALSSVQSEPIEANGIVYFGDNSGSESAIYATNGTLLWTTFLGQAVNDSGCGKQGVTSSAAVANGTVYVAAGNPDLYALNATTGAIEWQTPVGGGTNAQGYYIWSSPLIYGGFAYVGISSQCDKPLVQSGVDQFSLATHAVIAHFNSSVPGAPGSGIWGSPAINPSTNTIFVTTGNSFGKVQSTYAESLVELNASSLAVERSWQVPAAQVIGDGDFGVTPTLFTPANGTPMVTVANKNGILYAFDQSNLTAPVWQARLCCVNNGQNEHISTAWGGGLVYAVGSETTINNRTVSSTVTAFEPANGTVVWSDAFNQTSFFGYAAPTWVNGALLVPDQGVLYALNASSGAVLYQAQPGGSILAAASVARGEIFTDSTFGRVYAFDVRLGATAAESSILGPPPLNESFDVDPTGGLAPYRFEWNFGDGSRGTGQAPSHAFLQGGNYSVTVTVIDAAGSRATVRENLTVGPWYPVTFTENGLPAGSTWKATLGGITRMSDSDQITFRVANGTYSFRTESLLGYAHTPLNGSLTINGSGANETVTYQAIYLVTFNETGLANGTLWKVTLNGVTKSSTTASISFWRTNGSYAYQIRAVPNYVAFPSSGSVMVAGGPTNTSILFVGG